MLQQQNMNKLARGKWIVKFLHLAGTVWFVSCIIYILILTLRQAGVDWWVIFSLSGHSSLILLLLITIYLYAFFRGVTSTKTVTVEHPLTTTNYYLMFYVTTPLLAGITSSLAMIGENRLVLFTSGVALGTLGTTFIVWVIVDPLIASLELLLPQSRESRSARLAIIRSEKEKKQKAQEILLKQVLDGEQDRINHWEKDLKGLAESLSELLTSNEKDVKEAKVKAIEIGVDIWQTWGLDGMQQLRLMAMEVYKENNENKDFIDYISVWWDGIGNWRNTTLC